MSGEKRIPLSPGQVLSCQALCLDSSDTDSFFRPFFLRPASTLRPLAEDMRSLNPCLFFLFLLDGWNVRFMTAVINSRVQK